MSRQLPQRLARLSVERDRRSRWRQRTATWAGPPERPPTVGRGLRTARANGCPCRRRLAGAAVVGLSLVDDRDRRLSCSQAEA